MKIALVFCKIDDAFNDCSAGVFSIFESNPPLGLGAIGTVGVLRRHEVKIFDQLLYKFNNEQLIEKIIEYKPDIIGFSSTTLNITNSIFCAKKLKQMLNCLTFVGGIHATLCAQSVLDKNAFDFLISGEGEEVFEEVLDRLESNISLHTLKTQGFYLAGENDNAGVAVLSDINQPIIDRSIFDIYKYKNKGALIEETPCYSLFSSRGCPYKCRFCSKPSYFKNYRTRQVDKVITEIKYLIDEFGAKAISFREDNFTVDRERLKLFCNKMKEEFGGKFYWECESRADLPKELIQLMYDSGCRGIWCGVETIVPKWSSWINKGLDKETVKRFYEDCDAVGIDTGALFMFGFPEQTEDELNDDVEFAISLPTRFSAFQCLAIFPGSPLEKYYNEHKELRHAVTDDVFLALTKGFNYRDMIRKEQDINRRIKSRRLNQ